MTLDAGGVYTFQVEEILKGATAYGGGYQDSPDGQQPESILGTSVVTVSVGQRITQQIGSGGDTATLTIFVVGDTIVPTTFTQHGFTSPLIGEPSTPKAKTAMLNAGVLDAVAALSGASASSALGNLAAVFDGIVTAFRLHQADAAHPYPDANNFMYNSDLTPSAPIALEQAVRKLLRMLDQHMKNDDNGRLPHSSLSDWAPAGSGTGSLGYHVDNKVDWGNALLSLSTGGDGGTFVALADAWRAYDGHRQNTAVHLPGGGYDAASYVPGGLPALLNVHVLFLTEIQKQSPTTRPSVNAGATVLIHGAGFRRLDANRQ